MSKSTAGIAVSAFFTLASVFVPGISAQYRTWIFYACVALLLVSVVWWLLARSASQSNDSGSKAQIRDVENRGGNIQAAGRDAFQSVHHYHAQHTEPLAARADVSALSDFKKHRDEGERLLAEFRPGDGSDEKKCFEMDAWWTGARYLANRNVFQPFLTLGDLNRFGEPWPSQMDKMEALARAADAGQIKDKTPDVSVYGQLWERVEQVRHIIGVIESAT